MTNSERKHVTVHYDSAGKQVDGRTDPTPGAIEHPVYELNEGTIKPVAIYKKKPGRERTW